jgi:hypothetical protein
LIVLNGSPVKKMLYLSPPPISKVMNANEPGFGSFTTSCCGVIA